MSPQLQIIFAVCGIAIAVVRYSFYLRGIFRNEIVPHIFSWFIWGVLTTIVVIAQVLAGAGPGAWVTGFMGVMCFVIAAIGLKNGTSYITMSDWISFFGAFFAIGLWAFTNDAFAAVVIATIADAIGYIPTYRKAYVRPLEESAGGFALAGMRSVFTILALSAFNPTTLLHTAVVCLTDFGAAGLVFFRRRQSIK